MRKGYCIRNLEKNLDVFANRLLFDHSIPRRPNHVLHRVKELTIIVPTKVVNGNNVGVIQFASQYCFGEEFFLVFIACAVFLAEHFDGDSTVDRRLSGGVDDAYSPLSNNVQELVVDGSIGDIQW